MSSAILKIVEVVYVRVYLGKQMQKNLLKRIDQISKVFNRYIRPEFNEDEYTQEICGQILKFDY